MWPYVQLFPLLFLCLSGSDVVFCIIPYTFVVLLRLFETPEVAARPQRTLVPIFRASQKIREDIFEIT